MTLREQLIRDEERRTHPYVDCCGKSWKLCTCPLKGNLTIGVGRNLDAKGLSLGEIELLLAHDIADAEIDVTDHLPWSGALDDGRRAALTALTFNMGIEGLIVHNPKMLAALQAGDHAEAKRQLLDGPYKEQVGARAYRLADQLEDGVIR